MSHSEYYTPDPTDFRVGLTMEYLTEKEWKEIVLETFIMETPYNVISFYDTTSLTWKVKKRENFRIKKQFYEPKRIP